MSITSGFFNSLNGDRRYSTEQMSSLFDGIINDGVFMAIGDRLKVSASGGMSVVVGSGRAWFNHTWTYNDTDFYITVPASEIVLNRIDAIVLEVNADETVRKNTIKLVKGSPATNPVAPTLTNTSVVKQYPLAHIYVKANTDIINTSNITNLVGTSQCPWVTGIVETIDTDELVEQWQARFEEIYAQLENAIEQTLAAEVVDGSVTTPKLADSAVTSDKIAYEAVTASKINANGLLDKLGGAPMSKANEKLSTCAVTTGAKTMSFTVKGAGSASSNAWRRQLIDIQAWSQGGDFANMQMLVDLVDGTPYGNSKCFVAVGRNLPVEGIIYSRSGNNTTYTITFKADAMWALGYVTYKDGQGMSVVAANDISSGTAVTVDTYAAAPSGYGLGGAEYFTAEQINSLCKPGFYYSNKEMTIAGYTTSRWWMEVYAYGEGATFSTQRITTYYSGKGHTAERHKLSEVWGEWAWVNPPMILGSEYRTIETHNSKVVWTALFNAGTFVSSSGGLDVHTGILATSILRYSGECGGFVLPIIWDKSFDNPYTLIPQMYVDSGEIRVILKGGSKYDNKNVYIRVWYTKD